MNRFYPAADTKYPEQVQVGAGGSGRRYSRRFRQLLKIMLSRLGKQLRSQNPRMLLSKLSLADRASVYVEMRCKESLAQAQTIASVFGYAV